MDIYSVDSGYGFFTNDLKILLLTESIKTISSLPEKTQNLIQAISASSSSSDELNAYIKFLKASSDYFRKINSVKSYKLDSPEEYIQTYVDSFSKVDTYYRHVVLQFEFVKEKSISEDQDVNALIDSIHESYDRFLIELNNEWLDCMKQFQYKFNEHRYLQAV